MTVSTALEEASRCLYCHDAPCSQVCPAGVDVAGFIRRVATGNFQGAIALIREKNILAEVCGCLCPTDAFCEAQCGRSEMDRPIAIGALQAFVACHERRHGSSAISGAREWRTQRVAVVGAGPGGLGAAARLLQLGYQVEIFERKELPGGLVTYAIPPNKLEKKIMLFEAHLLEETGATFHMGTRIDNPHQLLGDFNAVIVAAGPGEPLRLDIEGENLEGVYRADAFLGALCRADLEGRPPEVELGKQVLVFGGGNTAVDCGVAARRLGADRAMVIYRRTQRQMPAWREEVQRAMSEEGVEFRFLTQPVRILGERGHLVAVECIQTELGPADETGRPKPMAVTGSEFLLTADSAIVALGYGPHPWVMDQRAEGVALPAGVFMCGDMVTRRGTIVEAVANGRTAAEAAHQYLSGLVDGQEGET